MEPSSGSPVAIHVADAHFVIRRSIGMLLSVEIHADVVVIPFQGEGVEFAILQGVAIGGTLGIVRIGSVLPESPVTGTIEVTVLHSSLYAFGVAHLQDVNLAASWPSFFIVSLTEQPERRPKTISSLWEFDAALHSSVSEIHLVLGVDSARCKLLEVFAIVVFLSLCREDEAASTCLWVFA